MMADSVLPVFGAWWRSAGSRLGDGAVLPEGATSTPYDGSAVPVGGKRWSAEIVYAADSPVSLSIKHNHFNAGKTRIRQTAIDDFPLAAGTAVSRRIDFVLNVTELPNWLPSIGAVGGRISFSSVKIYETPAPTGPTITVWDGSKEVPATISVWDGSKEVACTVEVLNG